MVSLAPYATTEILSRGRRFEEPPPRYRGEFQRDRDRIVHCGAFRRLEYKTQVFVNHEGDMFRTRLTHSIEVAQIGRSIARALHLNEDLTEAIALAHDLGHPPFGHAGQEALNRCMAEEGGFEHNLQSLRVVDFLEERYASFNGLNLTFEAREGILKHCSLAKAYQLGEVGRRFIEGSQPSLEAQVADFADAIAYNNHDVDDGLRCGILTIEQLEEEPLFRRQYAEVRHAHPKLRGRRLIHEIIRRMINAQVIDLLQQSQRLLQQANLRHSEAVRSAGRPLIAFSEEMVPLHQSLKQFLRRELYNHYRVHRMTTKAQQTVTALFTAFNEDNGLLPPEAQQRVAASRQGEVEETTARVIADYIAGMTDRYAITEHKRLFHPDEIT
ncbi:MAG: deoxyguanosinetriphosphate triphosphohydrolase [Gammaproteobacteria bacterium]|nr:deoxyguanosinetriphosphate triphosphohydrolase [Gammaproteobacteria bacterium]